MSAAQFFSFANALALGGWLALLISIVRNHRWLRDWIAGWFWPIGLAAMYAVIFVMVVGRTEGGFDSLASVRQLFQSDWVLVGGWIHYLSFDLFIGSWIAKQVMEKGWNRLWLCLLLPLTFFFGPIGLLAYAIMTMVDRKQDSDAAKPSF